MALGHNTSIVRDGLVFYYDMSNIQKSWKGKPTTNLIASTPLNLGVYAYASGPVITNNVPDAAKQPRTVYRYTITNAVNIARAAIIPSGLSTGINYSFSCKIKYYGNNIINPSFAIDASKGNPEGDANNNTISSSSYTYENLGNGWWYIKLSWSYSSCPTSSCKLTFGVNTGSDTLYINNTFDVYEPQFEINSFATPYINGTRTNTQAILDLTGNTAITANSLTYNNNGSFSFNGTSNYITAGGGLGNFQANGNNGTIEQWVYISGNSGTNNRLWCVYNTQFALDAYLIGSSYRIGLHGGLVSTVNVLPVSQWVHVVATYTLGTIAIYFNGISQALTGTTTGYTAIQDVGPLYIGQYAGGGNYYFNGSIPTTKIYNRALSAAEVLQNFEALRDRYGV